MGASSPQENGDNGSIGFERKDGVFKAFCKRASLSREADTDVIGEMNENPTVWKVSLAGTGDNPVRTDCMGNGYVRIGWQSYGNVEDFNDYNDFKDGGKKELRAFQDKMQVGDLVVSCYSAMEADAIGIVVGEYEYHKEGGAYPRYRNVKWLVKDIRENIFAINNNKRFTLSTIYRCSITAEDALKMVNKHQSNRAVGLLREKKPFVFIIDEINRGDISKVFGELFFSIDPGYRGEQGRVDTQYQNLIEEGDAFAKGFFVPDEIHGILFDGAWLWEEYLNTVLKPQGFKHPENKRGKGALHAFTDNTQRFFPDFYHEAEGMVLDAKYKRYGDWASIQREDLYQVISYMYLLKVSKGGFVFPVEAQSFIPQAKTLKGYGGTITAYGLSVSHPSNSFAAYCTKMNESEQTLVKWIAG